MIKEVKIEGVTCFAKLWLLQIYTHLSTFLASLMVNHFGVVIERIL